MNRGLFSQKLAEVLNEEICCLEELRANLLGVVVAHAHHAGSPRLGRARRKRHVLEHDARGEVDVEAPGRLDVYRRGRLSPLAHLLAHDQLVEEGAHPVVVQGGLEVAIATGIPCLLSWQTKASAPGLSLTSRA